MEDSFSIKGKLKYTEYLSCSVNKHFKSHSPAASSKKIPPICWSGNKRIFCFGLRKTGKNQLKLLNFCVQILAGIHPSNFDVL